MYKHELKTNMSQIQGFLGIAEANCIHLVIVVSIRREKRQSSTILMVNSSNRRIVCMRFHNVLDPEGSRISCVFLRSKTDTSGIDIQTLYPGPFALFCLHTTVSGSDLLRLDGPLRLR